MPRGQFDGLRLELVDGERVHVYGRPELFEQRGDFRLRALTIERFGVGAHLAALERLKAKLAAEGLFAAERKRPLPLLPRRIGLVTGNDAAAKRDVLTTIQSRFPPANVVVAETYVQGPRAPLEIVAALHALSELPDVDVIVLTRGGGSFEDLLPFSDERARARGRRLFGPRVSRRSDTSRTRRSATSPLTSAPRRRRSRASSSCRSCRCCSRGSNAHASLSRAVHGARSSATRLASTVPYSGCGPHRGSCSSVNACGPTAHTSAYGGRPRSRSSASAPRSKRRRASSRRFRRGRRSSAATRSSAGTRSSSGRAADVEPGVRVDVQLAEGGFGALVEETRA